MLPQDQIDCRTACGTGRGTDCCEDAMGDNATRTADRCGAAL